ncbi:hypothetical protein VTO42DRAFT_2100 [Malbranchea cinnamomea]
MDAIIKSTFALLLDHQPQSLHLVLVRKSLGDVPQQYVHESHCTLVPNEYVAGLIWASGGFTSSPPVLEFGTLVSSANHPRLPEFFSGGLVFPSKHLVLATTSTKNVEESRCYAEERPLWLVLAPQGNFDAVAGCPACASPLRYRANDHPRGCLRVTALKDLDLKGSPWYTDWLPLGRAAECLLLIWARSYVKLAWRTCANYGSVNETDSPSQSFCFLLLARFSSC